jgi:4-amino-4-deoxy-L-arabinose transferase-like glycosyltransferase
MLWASLIDPGQPPDEISHFDHIRYIATYHKLPVYGESYYIHNPAMLMAHAMLPPLYYLLGTPIQMLLEGQPLVLQLYALRSVSVLIGMMTVAAAYGAGRVIVPHRPLIALTIAAMVAFNPMFTYMSAAVNSDNLITTASAAIFFALAWGIRARYPSRKWLILLGILVGIGLLTKPTIATAIAAAGLTLIWLAWIQPTHRWRTLLTSILWVGGIALLISGWCIVRNWMLYNDPTGLSVIGTKANSYQTNPFSRYGTLKEMLFANKIHAPFFPLVFQGFWGYFDHYELSMPRHIYQLLLFLSIGSLPGLLLGLTKLVQKYRLHPSQQSSSHWHPASQIMLVALGGIYFCFALFLVINASYHIGYQPQGRYLFSAIVPLMILFVLGWDQVASRVHLHKYIAPVFIVGILVINMLALFTTVLPSHVTRHLHRLVRYHPTIIPHSHVTQITYGPFESHTNFVAEHAQIDQINMVLFRDADFQGPIIWRIAHQDEVLLSAVAQNVPETLSHTTLQIPQTVHFTPGETYTLSLQAPRATDEHPLQVLLPYESYTSHHPASDTKLNISIRYHNQPIENVLHDMRHALFPASMHSPRSKLHILLYPLVLILFLLLANTAMRNLSKQSYVWRWGIVIILTAGMVAVLQSPRGNTIELLTYQIAGNEGPLLTLDSAADEVYADLLLLAESPSTTKYPPDQPEDKSSAIQPLEFHMHNTTRQVLFMHATSAITYHLHLPETAYLETAIALNPVVWDKSEADGVEFVLSIIAQDGRHQLLQETIDPVHKPEQRTWKELSLDLSSYGNQEVLLCLEVLAGPAGNNQFDWAGWRYPKIVLKPEDT